MRLGDWGTGGLWEWGNGDFKWLKRYLGLHFKLRKSDVTLQKLTS